MCVDIVSNHAYTCIYISVNMFRHVCVQKINFKRDHAHEFTYTLARSFTHVHIIRSSTLIQVCTHRRNDVTHVYITQPFEVR
jgi:hypothetical protein